MRRRKPRVVWLPPTNANSLGANATSGYQIFVVDVTGTTGDFAVGEIPLTIDAEGQDPLAAGTVSLSDLNNSGYRLRRIVGKIFAFQRQQAEPGSPTDVAVTAGIIVRRVDPVTGVSLALQTNAEEVSPGEIRNYPDPWIWRRTWILSDPSSRDPVDNLPGQQTANFGPEGPCGGNADGPHVDQKTARIIGPEERLFLNVSSTILSGGGGQLLASTLVITDLRLLASMTVSSGNRRNASR